MTIRSLRFTGPRDQARAALGILLSQFPQVYFVERDTTEYEVRSSDAGQLGRLAAEPQWTLGLAN